MSNRQKLIEAIYTLADKGMREDLEERIAIWNEEPDLHEEGETFDIADAFIDLDDALQSEGYDNKAGKLCDKILIRAGYYLPLTDEQLQNTVVCGGAKKYDLLRDGIKYRIDSAMSLWIDG